EPVLFLCQEEDIMRLCSNLLSNAIRYARSQITVECCMKEKEAYLCVADDGDGIDEKDLPHIFERFYKGNGGVHGIGLSIVKSVLDRYGARIHVDCTPGARFEIWFPSLQP
ncbi:MAG: sensor histidine kinase, partial [Blautia sp.]|nr:sensor histidine kinase [Blautia sp.]